MRSGSDTHVEDTLRAIERAVLHDIRISPRWRATATAAAAVMAGAAAIRWWSNDAAHPAGHGSAVVVPVTTGIFLLAALMSMVALRTRVFRWCGAAAFTSALAAVSGLGALWWQQTGQTPDPLVWTLLCTAAVVVLTVTWLAVVLTPLEWSQPDMRAHYTASR